MLVKDWWMMKTLHQQTFSMIWMYHQTFVPPHKQKSAMLVAQILRQRMVISLRHQWPQDTVTKLLRHHVYSLRMNQLHVFTAQHQVSIPNVLTWNEYVVFIFLWEILLMKITIWLFYLHSSVFPNTTYIIHVELLWVLVLVFQN